MPLLPPRLDDLRFDVVANQLRRQIALFTPEWTDHNDSDPGITFLHLFAHLAEQLGFRMERLPDKAFIEMLKLVGVRLAPAVPARTLLAFYLAKAETAVAFAIGEAARIKGKAKGGPPPAFETTVPLDAVPAQLAALVTTQSDDLRDVTRGTAAQATESDAAYIAARFSLAWDGRQPKLKDWPETPVRAFARPAEAVHVNLWLGLAFNPLPSAGFVGQRVTLHVQLDDDEQPSARDVADCSLDLDVLVDVLAPEIELVYYRPPQPGELAGSWQQLRVIADGTAGFTRSGAIRFDVPTTLGPVPDGEWTDVRPAFAHPLVGGLKTPVSGTPAKVPISGWLGVRFRATPEAPIALRALTFNAAPAIGATTVRNEQVGVGNGRSDQTAQLANRRRDDAESRSILSDTLELVVEDVVDHQFHRWQLVEDFDRASADDRVYVLDPEAGTIYFGDGRRGRIPGLGARIVATRYRYTDGTVGELPVATITQGESLPPYVQDVTNVVPARGGRPAETLDEAKRRAPRELKSFGRAVTAGDFKLFAEQTPDANIAAAEIIPLRRPYTAEGIDRPGIDVTRIAPGAVSVVIVPAGDARFLSPTLGILRAVCRHLDRYRLVTTELYVVAPQYVRIFDISVTVVAKPGVTRTQLRADITAELERYLHVLHGGAEGKGFGFGVTLHHGELVAQIFRVPGVDRVEELAARYDGTAPDATPPMSWRTERQAPRNLVNCPTTALDDERIVLFPDETVFVDTATLNVIVQ